MFTLTIVLLQHSPSICHHPDFLLKLHRWQSFIYLIHRLRQGGFNRRMYVYIDRQYRYNTAPASATIQTLVRIAINTIDAQQHRCRRHDDMFGPASPVVHRNRGTSSLRQAYVRPTSGLRQVYVRSTSGLRQVYVRHPNMAQL